MKRCMILLPAALVACDSEPTVSAANASAEEVAAKVAAAGADRRVSPGRWEGTVTITHMAAPGMPPAIAERMKESFAKAHGFASCLTPEEAKRPRGGFFGNEGQDCRYDHFTMEGGTIDAAMTCTIAGAERTMTMHGTYGADAYRMDMTAKGAAGENPMQGMEMAMTVEAKRTGPCTGSEPG